MVATTILASERDANLEAFEEVLSELQGVTEGHMENLRRVTSGRGRYPVIGDAVAQACYTAAALRALAEAVAVLQKQSQRKQR